MPSQKSRRLLAVDVVQHLGTLLSHRQAMGWAGVSSGKAGTGETHTKGIDTYVQQPLQQFRDRVAGTGNPATIFRFQVCPQLILPSYPYTDRGEKSGNSLGRGGGSVGIARKLLVRPCFGAPTSVQAPPMHLVACSVLVPRVTTLPALGSRGVSGKSSKGIHQGKNKFLSP